MERMVSGKVKGSRRRHRISKGIYYIFYIFIIFFGGDKGIFRFGRSNWEEKNARPFLALDYVGSGGINTLHLKGPQHPCCQMRTTGSVEGGSEENPLGGDHRYMLVGHGTRHPESTEGMAEREGIRGKLGVGMGRRSTEQYEDE